MGLTRVTPHTWSGKKKMSYTERLEKIERGKGQSDYNPLAGHGGSGGGGKLIQRKKGG